MRTFCRATAMLIKTAMKSAMQNAMEDATILTLLYASGRLRVFQCLGHISHTM